MRFKNIKRWVISEDTEGLLFFAQRLDELLWDYTLDSYKPASLNAPSLCKEALALIRDIEKELIDETNLKHVLEELKWSISCDAVAKNLLDQGVSEYISNVSDTDFKLSELKRKLEVLGRSLEPYRYLHESFDLLMAAVKSSKKKAIDAVLKNTVTALVNMGVSKRFLYETTQEYFFAPDGAEITGLDSLEVFLKDIYPHSHNFDVYFVVSDLIETARDSVQAFGMKLLNELPEEIAQVAKNNEFVKPPGYVYVEVGSLRGFDIFSVQERAAAKLDQLSDLFTLFHHREKISWQPKVIVSQCCKDVPVAVTLTKGAMDKPFDMPAEKASKELNRLIRNIGLHGASFDRFNRVADLHGISVASDIVENQLVSLWTSLETLIPVSMKGAKVANVVESMMPFLLKTYIKRLISRLGHDLIIWRRWTTKKILNKVEGGSGSSISQRLLALLCVPGNEALRKELYVELGDFHLLRFRLFSLSEMLASPEKIQKALDSHEQKLRWQIRRIYRTRNLIVHSGSKPSYIHGLVENGHDYLDLILFEVMKLACGAYRVSTLEQAFDLAAIKYKKFKDTLSVTKVFDGENCQFLSDDENMLSDYMSESWRSSAAPSSVVSLAEKT
jgi:hypothetical protein